MTNEEAIMILENLRPKDADSRFSAYEIGDALNMAIKALEQEPCDKYIKEIDHLRKYICKLETQIVEQEHCEDAISRQAVLSILDDMVREYIKENDFDKAQGVVWVKVQKLSSVSTENPNRCDLISREWLKTAIHNFYYGLQHTPTEEDIQAYIDAAPSVSTEKKVNVLDKIRAEIMLKDGLEEALEIIDKYKAESEESDEI